MSAATFLAKRSKMTLPYVSRGAGLVDGLTQSPSSGQHQPTWTTMPSPTSMCNKMP